MPPIGEEVLVIGWGSKLLQLDCGFPIEPASVGLEPTVISTASVKTAAEGSPQR